MKPEELTALRKKHDLTLEGLGQLLGVSKAAVSRWEAGKRTIPPFLHIALNCLKVEKGDVMKRSAYLKYEGEIDIGKTPYYFWGHDTNGKFVCRLGITAAGISVYKGTKGKKLIGDFTWEEFVDKLTK